MKNSVPLILIVILIAAIACWGKGNGKESKDPMVRAFQTLEPEEKTDFISYFLALGLKDWAESQPRLPKFLTLKRPGWIIKSLNISTEKIEKYENAAGMYLNTLIMLSFCLSKIYNKHKMLKYFAVTHWKHKKMNIPKESRKKLLEWTKSEFNLTTTNILELFRKKKCPGSNCLPDIGELCCPW